MTTPVLTDKFANAEFFHALGDGLVNRDTNVIRGAAIIQLGDVADARPLYVDEITLQQVLQLSADNLRARVNHDQVVGGYLGRWKNLRLDGSTLRGDLHIAKVAFQSRGPATNESNLAEYVLGIAEEDPGAIGVSIAPRLDHHAMRKSRREDGRYPIRVSALRAADLVDTPAATHTGLFSADSPDSERIDPVKLILHSDGSFSVVNDDGSETKLPQTLSNLEISEEMLGKHQADLATTIGDRVVAGARGDFEATLSDEYSSKFFKRLDELAETFGESHLSAILPVVKGEKDAATFRAESAEAALSAMREELEKAQKSTAAPDFSGTDGGTVGGTSADDQAAKDKAAFEADSDLSAEWGGDFEAFQAYETAVAAGHVRR